MKKVKYLLLLGLFALITTGCVKLNYNIDIKKDKSMDFSIIYAVDKSLMGEDNSLKEEDMAGAKKQGFEVTKYSEGNYEGFKMTKKIANIDEVSTESDVVYDIANMADDNENGKYMFKVVKGTDKNTYTAKFKFNANSSGMMDSTTEDEEATPDEDEVTTTGENEVTTTGEDSVDLTNDMDLSSLAGSMDLSFNVNLPYGAISSNATTKNNDNKNLVWKLGFSGEQTIEFTFELKNNEGNNMMLYIGIGVGILLVILVLVLIISKKKKNNNSVPVNNTVNVETSEPVTSNIETPIPDNQALKEE